MSFKILFHKLKGKWVRKQVQRQQQKKLAHYNFCIPSLYCITLPLLFFIFIYYINQEHSGNFKYCMAAHFLSIQTSKRRSVTV